MNKSLLSLCFFIIFFSTWGYSQSTGNIPLHCKTKFNRYFGVGDVWGVQINNINYALVTLDGGLSVVNTNSPSNPIEIVHIDSIDYVKTDPQSPRIWIPDVETFTYNGTTYAYLATNRKKETNPFPLVMIINLNAAINNAPPPPNNEILIDPYNPSGPVYVGKINDNGQIDQSHTLTIAGRFLYVATMNDSLPVWDLIPNPANPHYLGFIQLNPTYSVLHEMYVKPITAFHAKIYAACVVGGLQVIDATYYAAGQGNPPEITVNSLITHLYDFDKAYPNKRESDDALFNYRATHSAWPTSNEQYIFTTDELLVWPPQSQQQYSGEDQNLYTPPNILRSPRREGTFLRVWQTSLLGQNNSLKGWLLCLGRISVGNY